MYALNPINGEVIWKINYGIPFKSHINLFDKKIYLIDQENKIICFDSKDGRVIWESQTEKSFIKSQSYLALALSKKKYTYSINSSGDLSKMNSKNGRSIWSIPTLNSLVNYESDFFSDF